MVENRWRRLRVIRAEKTMLVRNQFQFDIDQERTLAAEGCSACSAGEARLAQEKGLVSLPDSAQKFGFILQCLHTAHQIAESEGFSDAGLNRLEAVYGPEPSLRGARLLATYRQCQKAGPDSSSPAPSEGLTNRTDFQALLDSEISSFQTLLELHEASRNQHAAVMLKHERLLKQLEQHKERKIATRERMHRRFAMGHRPARENTYHQDARREKSNERNSQTQNISGRVHREAINPLKRSE